ncbi:hypothetical protein [uncultured Phascolarctobacterium sp.]|uniref:hypothetical protein n=1 Tax=uncultured Phascolarctobacterium sp. TaxID=512296 RepID=UPI0025D1F495|nr:hypothetical protein [uncultured Phascolarctobacterium sp.]
MTIEETAGWLQAHDRFLILTHVRPDGDTVGCAAALGGALRQDRASMKAGADLNINADAVVSANNALLYAGKDLSITTSKDIENKKSLLWAGENISVTADGFANLDTALISYGQNAEIKIADAFLNSGSTING